MGRVSLTLSRIYTRVRACVYVDIRDWHCMQMREGDISRARAAIHSDSPRARQLRVYRDEVDGMVNGGV